jgi:AsmA family protein
MTAIWHPTRRRNLSTAADIRRRLKWLAITVAASFAAIVLAVALLAAALDAGYLRGPFIRFLGAHSGRQIRIDGRMEAHFFSFHPRLSAERVSIGNPTWTPAGLTADMGKISLAIELPWFGHGFGIERIETDAATLHLIRDTAGRANWQMHDPARGGGGSLPVIHSLSMQNVRVDLDDARRHLVFDGVVSAHDASDAHGAGPLQIEGTGQLNGKTATFDLTGDPLAGVKRGKPYHFSFDERSSGSRLTGHGFLLRPFQMDALDTTFEGTGADLKDLYFLTGVSLMNTGSYRLSGNLSRRGTSTKFTDLSLSSGQSDARGEISIDSSGERPKIDAEVSSQFLHMADLGLRAAGREPEGAPALLLSNAVVSVAALRHSDAAVNFHAVRVEVGRVSLRSVAAKVTIDHGILAVAPLSADLLEGKLTGRIRLDATKDVPAADVDLKFSDLQLALLEHKVKGPAPVDGLMRARIKITGQGSSMHQVAATANGMVTAVLPHGTVRDSFAELSGIDLGGLGLILTKNMRETGVRCGVASFQAQQGTLTAQTLIVDTDPVLILGEGAVHMDSEGLDLVFRGHPKHLRLLRVRSPILMRGTLAHPSFALQVRNTIAQTAEAVALGVVLTPLAAVLAFVDPGLAKDADCTALLTAAHAGETAVPAAVPAH